MDTLPLRITGMSCAHCVRQVTQTLTRLRGVSAKTVTVGEAVVDFDPTLTSPADIAGAVTESGYPATPCSDSPRAGLHERTAPGR